MNKLVQNTDQVSFLNENPKISSSEPIWSEHVLLFNFLWRFQKSTFCWPKVNTCWPNLLWKLQTYFWGLVYDFTIWVEGNMISFVHEFLMQRFEKMLHGALTSNLVNNCWPLVNKLLKNKIFIKNWSRRRVHLILPKIEIFSENKMVVKLKFTQNFCVVLAWLFWLSISHLLKLGLEFFFLLKNSNDMHINWRYSFFDLRSVLLALR